MEFCFLSAFFLKKKLSSLPLAAKTCFEAKTSFQVKKKSDKILSDSIASNYSNTKFQFVISLISYYKNQESIKDSTPMGFPSLRFN